MRWLALTIAIACGACTALLGLDKVSSVDRDSDGVADDVDNCPTDANPDQSDFDHNGAGDACDLCTDGGDQDVDADGIPDGCDGCIGIGRDEDHDNIDDGCDACIGTGEDVDHDHIDDACDSCIGNGNDADHDGIDDACDSCVQKFTDTDADGIDDGCDPCVATPVGLDSDGDGIENACDPCVNGRQHDEDGDGLFDACDNCAARSNSDQIDKDVDGVGNACDDDPINHESFDAFDAQNPAWFVEGSGWTVGNDKLHFSGFSPSYRWLEAVSVKFKLEAKVVFAASPGPIFFNSGPQLIAFDTQSSSAATQLSCKIDLNGNLIATTIEATGTTQMTSAKSLATQNQPFMIQMVGIDSDKHMTCTARDTMNNEITADVFMPPSVVWFAGLQMFRLSGDFLYFDVLTSN